MKNIIDIIDIDSVVAEMIKDKPEWTKSLPTRNVYKLFNTIKENGIKKSNLKLLGFKYGGSEGIGAHVQGITRLSGDRFMWAHSTVNKPGRWILSTDSDKTKIFEHGEDNHPSPLQASGDLVIAPLTHLGLGFTMHSENKSLYLIDARKGGNVLFKFPKKYGSSRSGITFHYDQNSYYFVISNNLYRLKDKNIEKIDTGNKSFKGGQGGINLVYDEVDKNIYSFGFAEKPDRLFVSQWLVSKNGLKATRGKKLEIPFSNASGFDATPEGTSWSYGGGLKVKNDRIEIYKTDSSGGGTGNKLYVAVFSFDMDPL